MTGPGSGQMGGDSNTPPSASSFQPRHFGLTRDKHGRYAAGSPEVAPIAGQFGPMYAFKPVVDTLYISHEGDEPSKLCLLWLEAAESLGGDAFQIVSRRLKPRMALDGGQEPDRAAWSLRKGRHDGFASYRYIFDGRGDWDGVTVLVAPPAGKNDYWRWFVMVRAERLWRRGVLIGKDALAVTDQIVADLSGGDQCAGLLAKPVPLNRWKVSRIDVCRDHTGYDWGIADLHQFATSCPKWSRGMSTIFDVPTHVGSGSWTYGNKESATYYMGRRRSEGKMLRLYCKTIEAEKTGKIEWLAPYWRSVLLNGAQGPLPKVWRAEAEFGGGWLKKHGFTNATHLQGCEEALWDFYATTNRHTDGLRKKLRVAKTSKVWDCLSSKCSKSSAPSAWQYCAALKSDAPPDADQLRKQATGCLARIVSNHQYKWANDEQLETEVKRIMADIEPRLLAKFRCKLQPYATRSEKLARLPSATDDPFTDREV